MINGKKIKIAFVDYVLEPDKPGRTGLSDVVWDMASALVDLGHESHVIASYHTSDYPDSRVIVHNFPTPPIGYRNALGHFAILYKAGQIVRRINPDIVHTPEYVSTAVLATMGIKSPLVLTVPGNVYQRIQQGHGFEQHYIQILKWAAKVSVKHCASIIAISSEMKCWWEKTGSKPEQTPHIPYGVNIKRFAPVINAKSKLVIPEDKVTFLYLGRFSQEKGILDLLSAIEIAKLQSDRVRVFLIGKGPQRAEIERFVKENDLSSIIEIRDWVNQDSLSLWYSAADALIMPSWYEPLGRVVLEALSCGTPVIATNSGAGTDHVTAGKNGWVIPPRDPVSLACVLKEAVNSPELLKTMRVEALNYATNNITWKTIMTRIIREVYNPVLVAHKG